ncbi:hypothetical protein [Cryobacterium ruanii]|uniref:hypothetical protein n=1 Tax=Cryobacterium ruanii TaxID=1259197 RepID=UPI00141B3B15|nr:hypothetical protein [Cryobacterium ruanii]
MSDPFEEGAVLRKALAEHPSLDEEAEKRHQYVAAKRWREEHPERRREYQQR